MQIRLLGPIEVVGPDGQVLRTVTDRGAVALPTQDKAQALLVVLAHKPGDVVGVDRILDLIWGPAEKDSLRDPNNAVQKLVGYIRSTLKIAGEDDKKRLVRVSSGYRLDPGAPLRVDYLDYLDKLRSATALDDAPTRALALTDALKLWRGDPPSALAQTVEGESLWRQLRESRVEGEMSLVKARLEAEGGTSAVLGHLAGLTSQYPEHEWFLARYIEVLADNGRQLDALKMYDEHKVRLAAQDLVPDTELRSLNASIKSGRRGNPRQTATTPVAADVARTPKSPFNSTTATRDYLSRVINASRRLRFGDATREAGDGPDQGVMTLDKVWTPLQVALQPKDTERAESKTEEMAGLDALEQREYRRAVLLGSPGGGKSTIIAYRTLSLATTGMSSETTVLPIHVRLSAVATGDEPTVDDLWTGVHEVYSNGTVDTQLTAHLVTKLEAGEAALLFDGLDEVAEEPLTGVLRLIGLCDAAYPACPIIATCRKFDYELDQPRRRLPYPALELLPFELPQQLEYVANWYDALALLDSDPQLGERKRNLQRTLEDNPHLVEMGRTPLLTALMTLVHTQDGELPEARATLYRRAISHLLAETALWRERSGGSTIASQDMLILAGRVGYKYHKKQETAANDFRGLSEQELTAIVSEHFQQYNTRPGTKAREKATQKVQDHTLRLIQSNGLLVDQGGGFYDFSFKQYREFLAGFHLGTVIEEDETLEAATRPHWRECFQLLASHAAGTDTNIAYLLHFINDLADPARTEPDFSPSDAVLAAEMLKEIGREKLVSLNQGRVLAIGGSRRTAGLWPRIASSLLPLLAREQSTLPAALRIRAALALGGLGDPRFIDPEGSVRPLGERLVDLPAGDFEVGTDDPVKSGRRRLDEASTVMRRVHVPSFAIARYLTTNIEFRDFVEDGGYNATRWWTTPEAALWRAGDAEFIQSLQRLWLATAEENYSGELRDGTYTIGGLEETAEELCRPRTQPFFFTNLRFNAPTQPVVGVNFWESRAYCAWLTCRGRQDGWLSDDDLVRLPTEWEWERSTRRSGPARGYPWGDTWDPYCARTRHDGTELAHASPVGCYPQGTWEGGPVDLAGNVWEWTASRLLGYEPQQDSDRDRPEGLTERAIRGSSWYDGAAVDHSRCVARYLDLPGNIYFDLGFRTVVSKTTAN